MVRHLPPGVKQLLELRRSRAFPPLSSARLNALFSSTYIEAQNKNAETGWLVLTTCTLLTANHPAGVAQLYQFITRPNAGNGAVTIASAINRAALMRESALKSTIFVGVPRVILTLAALHEALDDEVKKGLRTQSRRTATPENIESMITQGRALWNSIYTPHADKLHDKLGTYHPDFIAFIIQAYGIVLSPLPGSVRQYSDISHGNADADQGNLSRALGSVVGVATLRAEGGVQPQLTSHVFGLLKARYVEHQREEDLWLASDEGTEWVIRTVDRILDEMSLGGAQARVKL